MQWMAESVNNTKMCLTRAPEASLHCPHQLQHTRAGSWGACSGAGLGNNNPIFRLPDFKIVPKTTERTLKFSFPLNRCNEMVFV